MAAKKFFTALERPPRLSCDARLQFSEFIDESKLPAMRESGKSLEKVGRRCHGVLITMNESGSNDQGGAGGESTWRWRHGPRKLFTIAMSLTYWMIGGLLFVLE